MTSTQTILLDTDFAIDFLRGNLEMIEIIKPFWEKKIAFLSLLSVYELYAGMRPDEKEVTDNFINACQLEPLTLEITKKAGEYRSRYRAMGLTLSIVDCLVAETAKTNNHLIATKNVKHFPEKEYLFSYQI